jgi:hypothetical protein
MKETSQELAANLDFQMSLLKLAAGAEPELPERIPVEANTRTLEQFVRVVSREAA